MASKACWIKIIKMAATNQTKRETIEETRTDNPFGHFLGSLGGSTFQTGIKHTFVENIPNIQASPELTLSATLFELSDKIIKRAGIMVEGTVPITLPTAPPYFSIKQATAIAIKKATDAERVGFRKFVLYYLFCKIHKHCAADNRDCQLLKSVKAKARKRNFGFGEL